ncbi:MAG: hypothetical protein GY953_55415, partial [bacterium]|nr:hypothetical protein [bacterium]
MATRWLNAAPAGGLVVAGERQRLLIICERDVGLFSLIHQVIAHVPRAVAEDRIPVVYFGSNCTYYTSSGYRDRDTVWEYYFEPLVEGFAAGAIPAEVAAAIKASPPSLFTPGHEVDELHFATSNFGRHPKLAGKCLKMPYEWDDPTDELRRT